MSQLVLQRDAEGGWGGERKRGSTVGVHPTRDTMNGGTQATEQQPRRKPFGWHLESLIYSAGSRKLSTDVWNATSPRLLLDGHTHVANDVTLAENRRVILIGRDTLSRNPAIFDIDTLQWGRIDDAKDNRAKITRLMAS